LRWTEYEVLALRYQAQEIIDGKMWLGPKQVAENAADLQNLRITAIVSLLGDGFAFDRVGGDLEIPKRLFTFLDNVEPTAKMNYVLAEAVHHTLDLMHCGKTVLVHCVSGLSLSASLVIAVMMVASGVELMTAYGAVFRKRPVININDGLFEVLQRYDAECRRNRGEDSDPDPKATKQAHTAYQLATHLRYASVTVPQAQNALRAADGDVEQAMAALIATVGG
jgi:hypothetical protein